MRVIHKGRLAGASLLVQNGLLGVTAAANAHHAEHLVADLEARGLSATLLDDARRVAPEGTGQSVNSDLSDLHNQPALFNGNNRLNRQPQRLQASR